MPAAWLTGWTPTSLIVLAISVAAALGASWAFRLWRRQRTELLRLSNHYRTLIEDCPDAMLLGRAGRLVYANREGVRLVGANAVEQVIDLPYLRLVEPSGVEQFNLSLADLRRDSPTSARFDLDICGLDGAVRRIELRLRTFLDRGDLMAIIVARDVSQQRAADQQMQLLASLVENSADLQGAVTASGELLYLNRTGRRLAGIESPAEPLGSALRFFDELDQPQVLRAIAEVAAGRERLTDLQVTSTASGLRIPMQFHSFPVLDARQEVVAVGTIARDLSDARRVERELRDRVQFQELIGGISALLFNTGPEDADAAIARVLQQLGTYSDADLAFVGRIDPGTARFESLHQSIRAGCKASVPLRDLATDAPAFWRVLQRLDGLVIDDCEQLGPGFEAERELLRAHGVRALLVVPIVMERRLNAVVGVSCAGGPRNFSPGVSALLQIGGEMIAATLARHAAAAELLGYSEALEALVRERTARIQVLERQRLEGEKLAATGRMSARIAHEINNPLAGIKNSFRLVRAAIPAAHPDAPYADRIDREIDRIANIVRQMYDLYRPERERPRRFQLAEALRDVVLLLEQNWLRAGISIDWSCRPEGLEVELAAMSLRQVLFNLLANAIEASPRGGRIAVKAELEGGEVLIEVLDQGNGIPEWAVDQIFEPFFTTKHTKDGSGLGLGLSVSRGLVEAMGGTLGFVSSPGHGTTFTIRVPLAGQRSEGHDEH